MKPFCLSKYFYYFLLLCLTNLFLIGSVKGEILNDKLRLNILSSKFNFIHFNFDRTMTVVITNQEELNAFSNIQIPFNFDPTFIYHNSKIKNIGGYFNKVTIDKFEVKSSKNQIITYTDTTIIIKSLMIESPKLGDFTTTNYTSKNLNIGDTITIAVKYNLPYNINVSSLGSYRLFFNENIDKNNFEFVLTHNNKLKVLLDYSNVKVPVIEENDSEKFLKYTWKCSNLKGCLNEPNARPYKSLPNVTINCQPGDFTYVIPSSTNLMHQPMDAIVANTRESEQAPIRQAIKIGAVSKSYSRLINFIEKTNTHCQHDSTGSLKLASLHNKVVNEFTYNNNLNEYESGIYHGHRFWKNIENKELNDLSRHAFYTGLITGIDCQYFTGYICDKRCGVISNEFYMPMFRNDFLMVPLLKDNTIRYLIPKNSFSSFYIDELPFYFESTTLKLVHHSDYTIEDDVLPISLRKINTPSSTVNDNHRVQNTKVEANLDSMFLNFNSRIMLKGQFSTLTRNLYKGMEEMDNINPIYNKLVYKSVDAVRVSISSIVTQPEFPFPTEIEMNFGSSNIVENEKK